MSSTNPICHQHTLSRGDVAHVQCCAHCASISIHIGPVSVRMDEQALRSLWLTLGDAVEKLDRDQTSVPPRPFGGLTRGNA
ncbi:hypothetical protein [Hyalangium versicolor]|uniref:hypothetical protein n=1 Tax=Hyalangium versicolor TaxID=2861190 RepID=UPI001CCEB637|nr:hypothetical protein [Hyalangium versicolor]